jgi:hypothetical protein
MKDIGAMTRFRFGVTFSSLVTGHFVTPSLVVADRLGLEQRGSLFLEPCPIPEVSGEMLCGSTRVNPVLALRRE